MDQSADIARIEADLAQGRATLAQTLNDLQARLSPDTLMQEATHMVQARLGPITLAVDSAVRANPLAAACVGIGAAWLVLGRKTRTRTRDPLSGTRFEAITRWEDEGGPPAEVPDPDPSEWIVETDGLRDRAIAALSRIAQDARDRLASADETARDRADILAGFATDTHRAIRRGLESLPTASQDAVAAVRERAYLAHRAAVQGTGRMIDDEPLLVGGMALLLGAGIAAVFPATEVENRLLGAERDRLVASARGLLEQERARASEVVAEFAGTMRKEVRRSAADLVHVAT